MKLAEHLQEFEGDLYDTRKSFKTPIRKRYCWHYREIKTTKELFAALRAGPYAWPGGYPLYFVMQDGGSLSFDTVRKELRNIVDSMRRNMRDGWVVYGCDINYEDNNLYDDHTGDKIESAHGSDEDKNDEN